MKITFKLKQLQCQPKHSENKHSKIWEMLPEPGQLSPVSDEKIYGWSQLQIDQLQHNLFRLTAIKAVVLIKRLWAVILSESSIKQSYPNQGTQGEKATLFKI